MIKFEMKMPIICLGCKFQAEDLCALSGRKITEEYLYDKKPDHCFLKDDGDGWVTLDCDKMPHDTVIGISMESVDSLSSAEPT